jgi:ribosomal protein L11
LAATRAGTKTEKKSPIEIEIRTPKTKRFMQSAVLPPISALLEEEMRDIDYRDQKFFGLIARESYRVQ